MSLVNPNLEGYFVARGMWMYFYNQQKQTFVAPEKCAGCYNNDRFVVWAVSVAAQAIVDGARIYPELKPLVGPAIDTFRRYKNTHTKGYSAAENSGSDNDVYYDDDAQVASAMVTAYEVTGDKRFLDQGRELVRFLMGGWHPQIGGMKWHVSKTYVNACTTAEVAKVCLQISKFIPNEAQVYVDFAAKCIDWQIKTLQDKDDMCIKDGVQPDGMKFENGKLLYNNGTTLSSAAHLYQITGDQKWLKIATGLAEASINPNVPFYDRDYPDMSKRYWRDALYFVQLLVEGLADYLLYVGNDVPQELAGKIANEIQRHLILFYKYAKDPQDGLYIQSFEPHNTFPQKRELYEKEFGGKSGKLKDEDSDGKGRPQKCLMGLGAAARIFFQGARVVPEIRS